MGTISDKLMRIINTKEDIRQALISKGYDVPTSIPFKEYAKMISDLPCRVDSFPDIEGVVARYSALGLTNEQMATNPVWVDKTGNGHDLQMKNFAWKEGSGISDVYPGALVFDGVDDYGVCDNFPILTKEKGYTVVALRQWISIDEGPCGLVSNVKHWLEDGAFVLESLYPDSIYTISFGATRGQKDLPHILTYQTSKSYNGNLIATGSYKGTDVLHVGKLVSTNVGARSNVAIWELVFLDHDATEEELTKIKDYFVKTYPWLFFDQAWTVTGKTNEDEDRATIANITGNGNDLVLSNFGFIEGSGYNKEGEYAGYLVTDGVDDKINSSDFDLGKDWTIVGGWTMLSNIPSNCGIIKASSLFLYNSIDSVTIYINNGGRPIKIQSKSINAICSDGRIYLNDWTEISKPGVQTELGSKANLNITSYGTTFTKMAFKNLAIYDGKILSKDDCIKAYNYLQTLKAK